MTRQQAGVSAEQLLREIVKTYDDPDMNEQIFSKYIHSLLATAPPEQAATKWPLGAKWDEAFGVTRDQPQATSAGALPSIESLQKIITKQNEERLQIIAENKRNYDALLERLAAHDQKVRAEVHESYEPMKEALSQFMKATLRIANDAAEIVTLRLPCHCDAQDGTPCTRCNVIREIRALAAPAASKPAQRAERKEPTTKP